MQAIVYHNVHTVPRRLYQRVRGWLGAAVKTHRVHRARLGGKWLKRITFADAPQAEAAAGILEALSELREVPAPLYRQGNQLWVPFVDGRELIPGDRRDVEGVLRFFASLYKARCRRIPMKELSVHRHLMANLDFLHDIDCLDAASWELLKSTVHRLRPVHLWLGMDYIDPLTRNFLITPWGLRAIDIDAFQADAPLGTGLCKAQLRWLDLDDHEIFAALARLKGPDLAAQWAYVKLHFLAAYAKQQVFRGRRQSAFEPWFESWLQAHSEPNKARVFLMHRQG